LEDTLNIAKKWLRALTLAIKQPSGYLLKFSQEKWTNLSQRMFTKILFKPQHKETLRGLDASSTTSNKIAGRD